MDGFSGKLSTGGCCSSDALKSLFLTSTGAMKRTLSCKGADEVLLIAAVADCLSYSIDSAG